MKKSLKSSPSQLEYAREYREKNRELLREKDRRYKAENVERLRAKSREYCAKNREKIRARSIAYYYQNRDRILAERAENRDVVLGRTRKYRAENPEKVRESARAYRESHRAEIAERRKLREHFNRRIIYALMAKQRGRCANCKTDVIEKHHVDHIVPIALGGSNEVKNLQLLCPPCNQRKHAIDPIDFAQREGRLL